MSDTQRILSLVRGGQLTIIQLQEMRERVREQLSRYRQALHLLDAEPWTYQTYIEVLRVGSGGNTGSVTQQQWDDLLPDALQRTKDTTRSALVEGQSSFHKVMSAIEEKLTPEETVVEVLVKYDTPSAFASFGWQCSLNPHPHALSAGNPLRAVLQEPPTLTSLRGSVEVTTGWRS